MFSLPFLSVGVNVSVDGFLSLYVSPGMNWRLVQGVPGLRPKRCQRDRLIATVTCSNIHGNFRNERKQTSRSAH